MKKVFLIICAVIIGVNVFAQENVSIENEIKAIENSLMKGLQVKGETNPKFNILERMKHYNVPGISIAVVKAGKLHWTKGYGIANTKTRSKVDANTLFQAGSISKPVAALAALKLYEDKKLDLHKDVNQYLRGWQIPKSNFTDTEKVTVQRLLTHTAGMTVHGFPGYKQDDTFPEITDVLNGDGNTSKVFVDTLPGSMWRYSGGGYTVMEKVVEDISGLSLETYLGKNILAPLGMKNSTYEQPISKEWQSNISAAYNGNGEMTDGEWNNYPEQAAAGLWTTPSDLARYCIEIAEIANGKENGFLDKATVDLMLTKHQNDWGLGPSLRNEGDSLIFGHGGKNEGFTNNMSAYAHLGHAVIVMTNADNGGKLIREIEIAISDYYKWNFAQPRVLEVIELSNEELMPYTGKYEFKAQGITVEFTIVDNKLTANTPIGRLELRPMTETVFVDLESSTKIEFKVDDKVTGFTANNQMHFEKKDE